MNERARIRREQAARALTELDAQYMQVLEGKWVRRHPLKVGEACLVYRQGQPHRREGLSTQAMEYVVASIKALFPRSRAWLNRSYPSPTFWNDASHRKVGDVLAVLHEARIRAKEAAS